MEQDQSQLRTILESIADGVIATDAHGRIELVNPMAEQLTGWPREEAAGRRIAEVFRISGEGERSSPDAWIVELLRQGKESGAPRSVRLLSRDGAETYVECGLSPIRDNQGTVLGVVVIFRDITTQRRMEEEQARAHKLESVGILAGGIAHDFNNLLTVIMGNISLAILDEPPGGPARQWLMEAERACLRARELSHQLLTFAKGGAPIKKTTSIGELVQESAGFVLSGSNVQCDASIPDDLPPVDADPGQLSQAINNVVMNAAQAMPDGGAVTIRCDVCDVGEGEGLPVTAGTYVRVAVEDHGRGIPAENLPRIFDPYFTTREKGSGLGLAVVYSIVAKHDGCVTVDSTPEKGSVFTIYLPASAAPLPAREESVVKEFTARGKVLVMDDDEAVRFIAGRTISRLGFQVEFAEDGAQALELYRQAMAAGEPFAAVIMDLTIPGGMGGKEAIQRLLEIDPGAVAFVSSGYSSDPVMADYRSYGFKGVITKPFLHDEVVAALRQVFPSLTGRA